MIKIIRKSLYKNGYLLIIAAWLYTISFIFSNYFSYSLSPDRVQRQFESYIAESEKKIAAAQSDTVFLNDALSGNFNAKKHNQYTGGSEGLFVYKADDTGRINLVYWSNNKMLPDPNDLFKTDGSYTKVQTNGHFELIKKTILLDGRQIVCCGIIPIFWNYGISNKYLQSKFPIDDLEKRYVVGNGNLVVKNREGKILLTLHEKINPNDNPGTLPVGLRILGIIFILIWVNALALDIVKGKGWQKGFGFLFCSLLALRFVSYILPFPFRFRTLSLFDSTIYASNFLHPTLGDLLINTILIYWLVSFVKSAAIVTLNSSNPTRGSRAWFQTSIISLTLCVIAFTAASIIRSLINDSQISFDVTNFFSLNIFSYLSFIVLCFIILSFFNISHILLHFLYKAVEVPPYARYVIVAVGALVYFSVMLHNTANTSNIMILVWLIVFMSIMEFRKSDIHIPMLRSPFFIIWLIFFAASISGLIIYQNGIINDQKRLREAEKLATEPDKNAQYIFSTGLEDIDSTFLLANLTKLKNQTANKAIKDSISSRYLSINADAYDTRIFTFDENDLPLYNDDSTSIFYLRNLISKGRETVAPDLYNYEKDINVFSFIYKKDLYDADRILRGYLLIVGDPKKFKSQTVYPELFMPGNAEEADKNITYAIYSKGKLVESSGNYNFNAYIPQSTYPKGIPENKQIAGNYQFWYNAGNGKLIITTYSQSFFLEFVTLFAYLFVSFLTIIILFQAGRLLVMFKFNVFKMRRGLNFNIRYQIQAAIVFLSLFSFIIIGFSTITFYINRFKQTNSDRLIKSIKILENEIENVEANHQLLNASTSIDDMHNDVKLQKDIKQIAEIHNVDANFYDLRGNLKATTQPEIYKKQILSRMMDPNAYYQLSAQQEIQVIQNEQVSNFSFLSIYVPVLDQNGKPYAYLNIPYLNTQKELNLEISNFLVTLINLNAFIFLIAGAISVLLTNRITSSFSLIADKMKKINIGTTNEEINWKSNDEIGALVIGYNKMVKKLEASAMALAKSEREGAWREMARQVAHEIKNPLTPMKLSIQFLEKAIQDNNPNTLELSARVTATLVEQIDQLAKIASDFSQFANITKMKMETFDVNDSLKSLIDLYSSNDRLNVTFCPIDYPALINADRGQINRLFTNLFQNAIEASEEKAIATITIRQELQDQYLIIHFGDSGSGIPLEKQDKIFTPNFTTKSSGTGLGLAICKGIVENTSGQIWFDTQEGEGTVFHISLPLVEMSSESVGL